MSDPYDQRLANESAAAEQCMKLGAVILKPPSQPTFGFTVPGRPQSESDKSK
jgi:hypothetical protein